jgi:hypothetical protein
MIKPDFLIIGGMKCGTSSLHFYLDLHPETNMTKDKDIDFFSKPEKYKQGLSFYNDYLVENDLLKGESSVSYAMLHAYPKTVFNIKEKLGEQTKFIYVVRDPIVRIISHYIHNLSAGRIKQNLNDFISNIPIDSHYLQTSRYYQQISGYLQHYSKNNILIISTENLKNQRKKTLKKVFDFLNIDSNFYDDRYDIVKHKSSQKLIYNKFGKLVAKTPFIWRYKNKIPFTGKKIKTEKISDENIKKLQALLKNDIQQFKEFSNCNFSEWETYNKQL